MLLDTRESIQTKGLMFPVWEDLHLKITVNSEVWCHSFQCLYNFPSLCALHKSSNQLTFPNFADPWRMVWADSHLLLREAELRPRTEYDRKPWEGVLTWRTSPCLPSTLSSWDTASCAEPASNRPAPPQTALHRWCSAPGPGESSPCLGLLLHSFMLCALRVSSSVWKLKGENRAEIERQVCALMSSEKWHQMMYQKH